MVIASHNTIHFRWVYLNLHVLFSFQIGLKSIVFVYQTVQSWQRKKIYTAGPRFDKIFKLKMDILQYIVMVVCGSCYAWTVQYATRNCLFCRLYYVHAPLPTAHIGVNLGPMLGIST